MMSMKGEPVPPEGLDYINRSLASLLTRPL